MTKKGVLSREYHIGRKTKRSLKYLFMRTKEVFEVIKAYKGKNIDSLCDVGTADAMMLDMLNQKLNIKTAVGLDFSSEDSCTRRF